MKKFFLALGLLAVAGGAAGDVVFEPLKSEVVVAPKAPEPVRFAAREATNFLARVLGAPVPIVDRPTAGRASLILGENAWSQAIGIDPAAAPRDTFFIRTGGTRVYVLGRDEAKSPFGHFQHAERATLHGLYAFLEDYAGCRFYFPGELGEVVPRKAAVRVPAGTDRRVTPDFLIRRWYMSDGEWFEPEAKKDRGKYLNWLRLRASTLNVPCCHGVNRIGVNERYAASHPEYFALKSDGTRHTFSTVTGRNRHGSLCFSSKVRDVIYDYCARELKSGKRYVDIMPNDGMPACSCDVCRKLCQSREGAHSGLDATDLIWGYTKEIAERLIAAGIPGEVTQMAYAQYARIPDFTLPTNINVMVAQGGPWSLSNETMRERQYAQIRAWRAKVGRPIWIWTYPHKHGQLMIPGIPDIAPKAWGEYYKPLKGDIFGTFAESETDKWIYHYLNYYVFSRVMWDASTDVDAVLEEHYRLMFGAAAKDIRTAFEIFERKWVNEVAGNVRVTAIGPEYVRPTETELWTKVYAPDVRKALVTCFDRATAAVAPDSPEGRRVAFFRAQVLDPFLAGVKTYEEKRRNIENLVWRAAEGNPIELRVYKFKKRSPPEEFVKTRVSVRKTATDLVVTYDCEDNRMDDLAAPVRPHDHADTWKDSGAEIFLNPNGDRKTFYHIIVNASGSVTDAKGVSGGSEGSSVSYDWDSHAKAEVVRRADGYTLVVTLPLASFDGGVKDEFPAEFVRNRVTKSGAGYCLYNWSPYVFGFNCVAEYGRLSFKPVPKAAAVELSADNVDVVVAPDAPPCVTFAAQELTNFLSRVYGRDIPVTRSFTAGRRAIVLGDNDWSRAAGIDTADFVRDQFAIRADLTAGRVYIAGKDDPQSKLPRAVRNGTYPRCEASTLFGVYEFLERFCDCRFYFPGPCGEIVPKASVVTVPAGDYGKKPVYTERRVMVSADGVGYGERTKSGAYPEKSLNWMRLRMETQSLGCCHGINKFNYPDRFRETHPEYLQMGKDGKRITAISKDGKRLTSSIRHLCYSSAITNVIYADVKAKLLAGEPYVDVMPQDGSGLCYCDACQAKYRLDLESPATELIWGWCRDLGNRLIADKVPGFLTMMAYSTYKRIPDFSVPTNIRVMVAQQGPWQKVNPAAFEKANAQIRGWAAKTGGKVWVWTYPHKFRASAVPGLPQMTPHAWGDYYEGLKPWICGTFAESESDRWFNNYLNYYVFSRIAWNEKVDVDAVLDEHYRRMFGAAADDMKAFYELLEKTWLEQIVGNVDDTPVGPVARVPVPLKIWREIYSPAFLATCRGFFAAGAAKVAAESDEAMRLAFVKEQLLGPLERESKKYLDGISVAVEEARRASRKIENLTAREPDFWRPHTKEATAPVRDTACCVTRAGSFKFAQDHAEVRWDLDLKPETTYRVSYYLKLDGVHKRADWKGQSGGVLVAFHDGAKQSRHPFPVYEDGTFDWLHRSFEITTPAASAMKEKPYVKFWMLHGAGTAWCDGLCVEEVVENGRT